jgi:hypothetical protein
LIRIPRTIPNLEKVIATAVLVDSRRSPFFAAAPEVSLKRGYCSFLILACAYGVSFFFRC